MTNVAEGGSAGRGSTGPVSGGLTPALFAAAVFASAALVFMVEPMIAKLVLPLLGGSPAVWNTSLAFFQAALLAGYGYAHILQRIRRVRGQILVHGAVLVAAGLFLPLHVTGAFGEPGRLPPALWLTGVLALSVGAPFAALSATAPMLQAWYVRVRAGADDAENPYVLYVASNLGSLLALLAYPVVVEPLLSLRVQALAWSLGYAAFVLVMAAAARRVWASGGRALASAASQGAAKDAPRWRDRLAWVVLAAIPSSLMLGVTTYVTTDVASAPFLWVAPLALYLTTFIIAFQTRPLIHPHYVLILQAATVVACFINFSLPMKAFLVLVGLHLACFFLTALMCHQALATRRPSALHLTEFYLWMSLGGVLGGAFNAFGAPLIFDTVFEYPLVLMLAGLVRPWGRGPLPTRGWLLLVAGAAGCGAAVAMNDQIGLTLPVKLLLAVTPVMAFLLRNRAWAFVVLCLILAATAQMLAPQANILMTERGFFGVLRITRLNPPQVGPVRLLAHGTTLHGAQAEDPAWRCRPLVYYMPTTPIGQVFTALEARRSSLRIGAIGMGAGTVAAYVRPADSLRFFEIDPLVIAVATHPANFSYIRGCARGPIDWVVGDARLTLAREPANQFDLLLVDAFSSDSVPAHLLTVEAMRSYLAHIKPDGVVIMHLSNRHLELMSPVAGIARAAGGVAREQHYIPAPGADQLTDTAEYAIIVTRNDAALAPFARDKRWIPADPHGVRIWTDDYSNLFGALVRRLQQPWR
jgi:hypothetical protein